MDKENDDSVYNLITKLCEIFAPNPAKVRKLRNHCYEVLLGKKAFKNPKKFKDVGGVSDPLMNLKAWCFTLTHSYDRTECAQELLDNVDKLKDCYGDDLSEFNSILTFLLCLKNIPKKDSKKLDLSSLPPLERKTDFAQLFKLPESISLTNLNSDKNLESNLSDLTIHSRPANDINDNKILSINDESPTEENIWEAVSKMKYSKRKCWESYGFGPPSKEKPFLSELGEASSLWVENLESLYSLGSSAIINSKLKPRKVFMKDLKYLLVGIPSETFQINSNGEFFLSSGVMVDGITPDTISRYCENLLYSGSCYRALNRLATPDPITRKYKYSGYIFTEFCDNIFRYLQFYRTAIMSIPDSTSYLTFDEETNQLQKQIITLAKICKIRSFTDVNGAEEMLHGVDLLNYLYQKLLTVSDKNLALVLYSILYPCCQVYFSRFLHQWILKGSIIDPYSEFFIIPNSKYLPIKGRTYWTRSYEIRTDLVPDFLADLKDDILFCGKMINLLQLCCPMNKFCLFLMGKSSIIFSCCLTHDQLNQLEQNTARYFLEASAECGYKFSFTNVLERSKENDLNYLNLIAKKRAVTLQRMELERKKAKQEEHERKLEEISNLKEQYEAAMEHKQINICREIRREISYIKENLKLEETRENLIKEEANNMIQYYSQLSQAVDKRKEKIDAYLNNMKKIHIDIPPITDESKITSNKNLETDEGSTDSFYSVQEGKGVTEHPIEEIKLTTSENEGDQSETKCEINILDYLNANTQEEESTRSIEIAEQKQFNSNFQQAKENFEMARQIKRKVLNQELGITITNWEANITTTAKKEVLTTANLTEAQRNKLKILSSEFGIDVVPETILRNTVMSDAEINKNKIMGHDICFTSSRNYYDGTKLDNENFVNKNVQDNDNSQQSSRSAATASILKKSKSLQLDFDKLSTNKTSDTEKTMPMSVDSTPLSELTIQTVSPLSDLPSSIDMKLESIPNTAESIPIDSEFEFKNKLENSFMPIYYKGDSQQSTSKYSTTFFKRVNMEEAQNIPKTCLQLFLYESVSMPLLTQLKLANNEMFKYFIDELNYLNHLESLRDYFFLQDGEFGRNITENLFEQLYNANFPLELINFRTLQHLVFSALENSNKYQANSKCLSFKIESLPKCFDLGDPDVLHCISLSYKVQWPLNILLSTDIISKYDQVFKFLLKLSRVSWVLKKIFLELKILAKETGEKEIYLMCSPQYRRLHQCRHVMSHFVQTLQSYIIGGVLQPSWKNFEKSLLNVRNFEEMYVAHKAYIKNILFSCMLDQRTALKTILQKIFIVILKFYDYLRSRRWICQDGSYMHPNFTKLERIFDNFEEFVTYFFKVIQSVGKTRCQLHLEQFLDALDVNYYYSKKLLKYNH